MSERCEALMMMFDIDLGQCHEDAIGRFTGTCVHEHVLTRWLCADHAGTPETASCRICWDGPQAHDCPIVLTPAAVTS